MAALDFSSLPQQLVNGILLGAIYALIALGYTMVYGVLRLINFAHGEVFMLGAYTALLTSFVHGFGTGGQGQGLAPETLRTYATGGLALGAVMVLIFLAFRKSPKQPKSLLAGGALLFGVGMASMLVSVLQPKASTLFAMLLASMVICGFIGVTIELLAYRPMRNQARISALITAIGVSLLLQYGGALFLPNAPPPSINEQVNPYRGSTQVALVKPAAGLQAGFDTAKTSYEEASARYDQLRATVPAPTKETLNAARDERNAADRALNEAQAKLNKSGLKVQIPTGQLIMLLTTLALMALLTYLVLYTAPGRAMRAVSHDFDSAALMGVNVGRIISFTFLLGSMLAGAGAMMNATFIGTPLTTFYGVQPGVKAFVAAVLGGIGNIPGAVLGGLLMGVAETLVVWVDYSNYRDAIAFVILIAALLFRPGGLLGSAKVEKV